MDIFLNDQEITEKPPVILFDFLFEHHFILFIRRIGVDQVGTALKLLFLVEVLYDLGKMLGHVIVEINGRLLNDISQQTAEILLSVFIIERCRILSLLNAEILLSESEHNNKIQAVFYDCRSNSQLWR